MNQIVDVNGQPFRDEIATVAKDITFLAFAGLLSSRDDTLLTRGGNKSYKVYDELERDPHCYGLLQKRKLAVVARPWQVDAASEDPLDVRAADVVRAQLEAIGEPKVDDPGDQVNVPTNFDLVCYNLLDAILKGFAAGEIMWDYSDDLRQYVVREVRPRDQRRFNFDTDYKLRLKTWQQLQPGEQVPARKFIVHTFGAKDGFPYGVGLGSKLFWPVLFKRENITFWLTFLDKFGSPTPIGKYPAGSSDTDQDKLFNAVMSLAQDAGAAIPDTMQIDLLEATRAGTVSYESFCRYMDEAMTFAVLGEAPTSRGGGGAQQTAAVIREEVRLELVQADADLLSATLNATLSPWITYYNVPGAKPPKIWRQVKQDEDLKARSERDKNLFEMGYRPTLKQVTETYGGEWEVVPPVVPGIGGGPGNADAGAQGGNLPQDFAEALAQVFTDQVAVDNAVGKLSPDVLQRQAQAALKPVLDLIAASADYAEVFDKLAESFPAMTTDRLETVLARAMFVSSVWGRVTAASTD